MVTFLLHVTDLPVPDIRLQESRKGLKDLIRIKDEDCMPIGGVVIMCKPDRRDELLARLEGERGVEIHGADERGNIVAVLDAENTEALEKLMKRISGFETVLQVGLTYLNTEDETEKIVNGEYSPKIFGMRRDEKFAGSLE
jgi:nitrate reductase NapD